MHVYCEATLQQDIKYEADLAMNISSSPCGMPFMSPRRASLGSSGNYSTTSSFSNIEPNTPSSYDSQITFEPVTRDNGLPGLPADVVFSDSSYLDSRCLEYSTTFESDGRLPQRQLCLWNDGAGFDGSISPTNLHLVADGSHLQQEIYSTGNSMQHEISFLPDTIATLNLQPLQGNSIVPGDLYHDIHTQSTFSPLGYGIEIHTQQSQFQPPFQQNLDQEHYLNQNYSVPSIEEFPHHSKTSVARQERTNNKSTVAYRTRTRGKVIPVKSEQQSRATIFDNDVAVSTVPEPKHACLWFDHGARCSRKFLRKEHMLRHLKIHIDSKRVFPTEKGTASGKRPKREIPEGVESPAYWEPLLSIFGTSPTIDNDIKKVFKEAIIHGIKIPDESLRTMLGIDENLDLIAAIKHDLFGDLYCMICDKYYSRRDNFRQHLGNVHFKDAPSRKKDGGVSGRGKRLFIKKANGDGSEQGKPESIDDLVFDLAEIQEAGLMEFYQKYYLKEKEKERVELAKSGNIIPRRKDTTTGQRRKNKRAHRAARIPASSGYSERNIDADYTLF